MYYASHSHNYRPIIAITVYPIDAALTRRAGADAGGRVTGATVLTLALLFTVRTVATMTTAAPTFTAPVTRFTDALSGHVITQLVTVAVTRALTAGAESAARASWRRE